MTAHFQPSESSDPACADSGRDSLQVLINIDVEDLDKAIAFYTSGLGLRLGRRLFEGSVAEMVGASSTIHLIAKPEGSPAVPESALGRSYERHWTPVHLDFVVADVDAAVERARTAGARAEGEPESYSWGRLARLSDPFGHGLCLVELSSKGYDAAA